MKPINIFLYCILFFSAGYSQCPVSDFEIECKGETWFDTGQRIGFTAGKRFDAGDMDGDGDIDIVARFSSSSIAVNFNDGTGYFTLGPNYSGYSNIESIRVADFDNDGDLDVLVLRLNSMPNKILFNDGLGNLTDSGQDLGLDYSFNADIGDLDGDGDLDIFVANAAIALGGPNKVYLNDGNGNFTWSGQDIGSFYTRGVSLGDLDGDGDLDAYCICYTSWSNHTWLNDGSGFFTDTGEMMPGWDLDVQLGDMDGDGDLDAVSCLSSQQPNKIYYNDGTGHFPVVDTFGIGSSNYGMYVVDFEGDGDLDVFVATSYQSKNELWLNDGLGNMSLVDSMISVSTWDIIALDLDGDGDLDLYNGIVATGGNSVLLYQCPGLCEGDSTVFSVSGDSNLGSFNWTVLGGTTTSGVGTNEITINWGPESPGSVEVDALYNLTNTCADTMNVNVLSYPEPAITGNNYVLDSSCTNYYQPVGNGNIYDWEVIGGTITWSNSDSSYIGVCWEGTGTGILTLIEKNRNGCTSYTTLDVMVTNCSLVSPQNATFELCEGDSLLFDGSYIQFEGTYNDTLVSDLGCDSIIELTLSYIEIINNIDTTICTEDSFYFNFGFLQGPGNWSDTIPLVNGCDSIVNLQLNINPRMIGDAFGEICMGDSMLFQGEYYQDQGTYVDTITDPSGCWGFMYFDLIVNSASVSFDTLNICSRDSVLLGGAMQNQEGTYFDTLINAQNCDSIIFSTLTYFNQDTTFLDTNICEGEALLINGQSVDNEGVYYESINNQFNCDSIVEIEVFIWLPDTIWTFDTICEGDFILLNGDTLEASGQTDFLLPGSGVCDTVLIHTLWARPSRQDSQNYSICPGDSIDISGFMFSDTGAYQLDLSDQYGCDSLIRLNIDFLPSYENFDTVTLCNGEIYLFSDMILTQEGDYDDFLFSQDGCDSIIHLTLQFHPFLSGFSQVQICEEDSFFIGGDWQTEENVYSDTFTVLNSCDSVHQTTLMINTAPSAPQIVYNGNGILSVIPPGDSVEWYYEGMLLSGSIDDSLTTTIPGNYSAIIWENECPSSLSPNYMWLSNTESLGISTLDIFPIPFEDELQIKWSFFWEMGRENIEITNTLGQKLDFEIDEKGPRHWKLNVSDFSKGIYFVRIKKERRVWVQKIVKN